MADPPPRHSPARPARPRHSRDPPAPAAKGWSEAGLGRRNRHRAAGGGRGGAVSSHPAPGPAACLRADPMSALTAVRAALLRINFFSFLFFFRGYVTWKGLFMFCALQREEGTSVAAAVMRSLCYFCLFL